MSVRIVGRRLKPDGEPLEIYRFDTGAPTTPAQRFTMGFWRDHIGHGAPTAASLIGSVQRGHMVDLPVEGAFDLLDAGAARVERFYIDYPIEIVKAVTADRSYADAWLPVLSTHVLRVVTLTGFAVGEVTWYIVERGEIEPPSDRSAITGRITSGQVQASMYLAEAAARKQFASFVREAESGDSRFVAYPATAQADGFSGLRNSDIARGLAAHWVEKHAAEAAALEAERKKAEDIRRAVEVLRERERLAEEERQRKIAAGDVSVLDDTSLAAKLRAKRAKGGAA